MSEGPATSTGTTPTLPVDPVAENSDWAVVHPVTQDGWGATAASDAALATAGSWGSGWEGSWGGWTEWYTTSPGADWTQSSHEWTARVDQQTMQESPWHRS